MIRLAFIAALLAQAPTVEPPKAPDPTVEQLQKQIADLKTENAWLAKSVNDWTNEALSCHVALVNQKNPKPTPKP